LEGENVNKSVKSMVIAGMMSVLALGSTGSFAYTETCPDPNAPGPLNGCDIPGSPFGIVPGSYPYFDNVVAVDSNVKFDKAGDVKNFNIKAKQYKGSIDNNLVVDDQTSYLIDKPKYDLKAKYVPASDEFEGSVKISGKITPLLGAKPEKFSVTANLAGPFDFSADGTLWGLNTSEIQCKGLENVLPGGCTDAEVVYLNLLEGIGPDFGEKISTAGRAITSVPLPAAAWLFVSGLLGLVTVSRRRGQRA
jgi:hypothetical protein